MITKKQIEIYVYNKLKNKGWNTNLTDGELINDMVEIMIEVINKNDLLADVSNRTCSNCYHCVLNPSSEGIHDKYKCFARENIVTITDCTTHVCDKWTEIPF